MGLTVTTPPASTALVEVTTVRSELPNCGAADDPRIQRLISVASEAIAGGAQSYFGFPAGLATYKETLPGTGTNLLILARTPIVSVTTVTHRGDVLTDFTVENAEAGLLHRQSGFVWAPQGDVRSLVSHALPGTGRLDWEIDYQAGWLLPGENNRSLPAAIEEAALETVKRLLAMGSGNGTKDVVRQKIGDTEVQFADTDGKAFNRWGLPPVAVALLRPYRRLTV